MRRHTYTSGSGFFIWEHFNRSRMKKLLPLHLMIVILVFLSLAEP